MEGLFCAGKHISSTRDTAASSFLLAAGADVAVFALRRRTGGAGSFFLVGSRVVGRMQRLGRVGGRGGGGRDRFVVFARRGAKHPVQQASLAGEAPALVPCQVDGFVGGQVSVMVGQGLGKGG